MSYAITDIRVVGLEDSERALTFEAETGWCWMQSALCRHKANGMVRDVFRRQGAGASPARATGVPGRSLRMQNSMKPRGEPSKNAGKQN